MLNVYSHKEAIKKYVRRYLSSDREAIELDLVVRDSLSALVLVYMREIASHQAETVLSWTTLVDRAIDLTRMDVLKIADPERNPRVQAIESYLPLTRKELERTAKEIAKLQNARVMAHSTENPRLELNVEEAFEITMLGSSDHVQGFFVSLVAFEKAQNLNIETIKKLGKVRGDWFPFEIQTGDMTVVLDDDGSLYTSTENLPSDLVESNYENIQRIAEALYTI